MVERVPEQVFVSACLESVQCTLIRINTEDVYHLRYIGKKFEATRCSFSTSMDGLQGFSLVVN